jgi:hypothetical protein
MQCWYHVNISIIDTTSIVLVSCVVKYENILSMGILINEKNINFIITALYVTTRQECLYWLFINTLSLDNKKIDKVFLILTHLFLVLALPQLTFVKNTFKNLFKLETGNFICSLLHTVASGNILIKYCGIISDTNSPVAKQMNSPHVLQIYSIIGRNISGHYSCVNVLITKWSPTNTACKPILGTCREHKQYPAVVIFNREASGTVPAKWKTRMACPLRHREKIKITIKLHYAPWKPSKRQVLTCAGFALTRALGQDCQRYQRDTNFSVTNGTRLSALPTGQDCQHYQRDKTNCQRYQRDKTHYKRYQRDKTVSTTNGTGLTVSTTNGTRLSALPTGQDSLSALPTGQDCQRYKWDKTVSATNGTGLTVSTTNGTRLTASATNGTRLTTSATNGTRLTVSATNGTRLRMRSLALKSVFQNIAKKPVSFQSCQCWFYNFIQVLAVPRCHWNSSHANRRLLQRTYSILHTLSLLYLTLCVIN